MARRGSHLLCRPPGDAMEVMRWDGTEGKRWVPDDGKPGLAFSGRQGLTPYAWKTMCGAECYDEHPDRCLGDEAMAFTAIRFGCANGRSVPPLAVPPVPLREGGGALPASSRPAELTFEQLLTIIV